MSRQLEPRNPSELRREIKLLRKLYYTSQLELLEKQKEVDAGLVCVALLLREINGGDDAKIP